MKEDLFELYENIQWSFNRSKKRTIQGRIVNMRDIPKLSDSIGDLIDFIKENYPDKMYTIDDIVNLAKDDFDNTSDEAINALIDNDFTPEKISMAFELSDEMAEKYLKIRNEYLDTNF